MAGFKGLLGVLVTAAARPRHGPAAEHYALADAVRDQEESAGLLTARSPTSLLPHPHPHAHARARTPRRRLPHALLRLCTLRRALAACAAACVLLAAGVLWSGIPPSFDDIREFERRLPQHDLALPPPEGTHGVYLRFPDHLWGHGLNNVLQEIILLSHLALRANRSFVFEDYTWSHTPLPYTLYDFALRPARIPLNAFISGPSAGAPMPAPRAVARAHWDAVCPPGNVTVVSARGAPSDIDGEALMRWWVDKLAPVRARCVEVESREQPVFDRYLFGSKNILSLWPALAASPVLAHYTWSPLVHAALARNFALLQPLSAAALLDSASSSGSSSSSGAQAPLPGLLAVHVRRGDYERHCARLAAWGSLYMGFNEFPGLPDTFDPRPYAAPNASPSASRATSAAPNASRAAADPDADPDPDPDAPPQGETRREYYMRHCLPSAAQVAARLRAVRAAHPAHPAGTAGGLRRVFVLTNAGWAWRRALERALRADGWADVRAGADLVLDAEQRHVAMAVDMAIAERAEVFVGNGFSSLTANIVMLRLARGMEVGSNRFL